MPHSTLPNTRIHTQPRTLTLTHGFLQLGYCCVCVSVDSLFFDLFFFWFHKLTHMLPAASGTRKYRGFAFASLYWWCNSSITPWSPGEYTHWRGSSEFLGFYCLVSLAASVFPCCNDFVVVVAMVTRGIFMVCVCLLSLLSCSVANGSVRHVGLNLNNYWNIIFTWNISHDDFHSLF